MSSQHSYIQKCKKTNIKQEIISTDIKSKNKYYFIEKMKKQIFGEAICQEDLSLIKEQHSARFIAERAIKHKQNLAITTFGPLTNLAQAFHYDYNVKNIEMVNLLGGQFTGVGNILGQYSEQANFHFDPQAAEHIIFHNFKDNKDNVYITPIQKTLQIDWKQRLTQVLHPKGLDQYKCSLLNYFCRYDFVSIGPLLAIFPIMI